MYLEQMNYKQKNSDKVNSSLPEILSQLKQEQRNQKKQTIKKFFEKENVIETKEGKNSNEIDFSTKTNRSLSNYDNECLRNLIWV